LYLTHTRLDDQLTLRLCVGQTHTERRHVEQAWQRIQEVASEEFGILGTGAVTAL